ncbi:hypothetical protein QAD02_010266 [Eretmocerus hayati]|uniref:Uncharacterized protein n=1 Tax=Eretmocerus hayati TaxID=131215 RepID=A0ACC2NC02_9HYME|nr:hypothetical protein QAD02_010266 [Eretmocerus hayati]
MSNLVILAYTCASIFLYSFLKHMNHRAWQLPGPPSRLLLVTAHPDDEVMFFGPMICSLIHGGVTQIYLLCLSMGGDKQRKNELWACANQLGIPDAHVTIVMCTEMPDDPAVQWPDDVVAKSILQHVESYKIDTVVTFDKHGVSSHKNHISIYYAIAMLCIEKRVPLYCKLYTLETVNIFRKYIQLLDLPISLLSGSYWYLISYQQRHNIHDAMKKHRSQYVWFRKLFMVFSRYTLINTLNEVNILDLELDLQFDDDDD